MHFPLKADPNPPMKTSEASPYLAVLLGGGGGGPMVHKYVAHDTLIASSTVSSSFFSLSFSFTL